MKNVWFAVVATLLVVLMGCSKTVGPSDAKVKLDLIDRMKNASSGMLEVSKFKIGNRIVYAEDRVGFHVEVTFAMNKGKVKEYQAAQEKRAGMFGTIGGPDMSAVKDVEEMDGQSAKFTLLYKLNSSGVWQSTDIQEGYR